MLRLSESLAFFKDNLNIEIYRENELLFNDTKEEILENVDYQDLFANHFVEHVSLNTDWWTRLILKIYID